MKQRSFLTTGEEGKLTEGSDQQACQVRNRLRATAARAQPLGESILTCCEEAKNGLNLLLAAAYVTAAPLLPHACATITGEAPVSATGFWTLFLSPTQRLFFSQQRAYKLANVSHTLVSKVETIAACERERVAHVCCAALAQCMPVHAHCGAHACSVPQEERKSQCTIWQSCNLKLPRRCQSNTQFCALCRFGRQTWT